MSWMAGAYFFVWEEMHPDWFWGPFSLLSIEYREDGVALSGLLVSIVLRLIMHGAVPPLTHTSSMCDAWHRTILLYLI